VRSALGVAHRELDILPKATVAHPSESGRVLRVTAKLWSLLEVQRSFVEAYTSGGRECKRESLEAPGTSVLLFLSYVACAVIG
jgi:hypothetical protein